MQTIDPKRKLNKPVSYHLMSLTLLVATVLLIDVIFGMVSTSLNNYYFSVALMP
ncbi:uncharacterized protein METZ01_LOCUS388565 [marine metagenome]|uniref:Uncharacterized protein n=1 Tax=marine metagenome TaxID=408172 RepID=A0A382UPV6_9ZZZZ